MTNFKCFSPLQRLNAGLSHTKVFGNESKLNPFGNRRHHRFAACNDSFRDNLLGLNYSLRRIGEHYRLTYKKEDRIEAAKNKTIQNTILLSMDIESFIVRLKESLDCLAFFIPFYYRDPLIHKKMDARDLRDPWAFRTMKKHFIDGKTKDRVFKKILIENGDWIEDILWKRDILCHKFHRLSIDQDYWTNSCYAYLYEFNKKRDFIPDVLSYVSIMYFKLVKLLILIEAHFKNKCEKEIAGYQYFYAGSTYANRMNKIHYFFASFGKILDGKILIRIHPNMRNEIEPRLRQALSNLKIKCPKCKETRFKIKPTTENFVLIAAYCDCQKTIYLGDSVSKRFFPHFFDKNKKYWGLVPVYELEEKATF